MQVHLIDRSEDLDYAHCEHALTKGWGSFCIREWPSNARATLEPAELAKRMEPCRPKHLKRKVINHSWGVCEHVLSFY